MSAAEEQVEQLLRQATGMSEGPSRVAVIDEAIRTADLHHETLAGWKARRVMLSAALAAGFPDVLTAAFTWCLAQSDREPERYPERELLWEYRWVIHELTTFPQVEFEQFQQMLADMRQRYIRAGSTLRSWYTLYRKVAIEMGDEATARRMHADFLKAKKDWLTDSHVSEHSFLVEYLSFIREDAEAIHQARPILTGEMRSLVVPHSTYPDLILPAIRQGDWKLAMTCFTRGYPLIARQNRFLKETGKNMLLLGLTENFARGLQLMELHLPVAATTVNLNTRFEAEYGGLVLLDCLLATGKTEVAVRLPEAIYGSPGSEGSYDLKALRETLHQRLSDLATRFDTRNRNSFFHDRLREIPDLMKLGKPLPLPRKTDGDAKSNKWGNI